LLHQKRLFGRENQQKPNGNGEWGKHKRKSRGNGERKQVQLRLKEENKARQATTKSSVMFKGEKWLTQKKRRKIYAAY